MRLKIISFFLLLIFIHADAKTQQYFSNGISLSSYLFKPGNDTITSVISNSGKDYSYSLSGKNAGWFSINGDKIILKPRYQKKFFSMKQVQFSVVAKENKKVISRKTFTLLPDTFHKNPVIAHRGAWKNTHLPENSVAALKAAISLGCAGSETDLHMTEDSALVINHDPVWAGIPIQKNTLATLRKTNLSNGEPLPLLEDFLKVIKQQAGTKLILEIKPSEKGREWAKETVKKVMEKIHQMQAQAWLAYISFDYEILKEILKIEPSAHVQYLNGDKSPEELKKDGITGADYHYSVFQKHPEWIEQAKENKIVLNAWTVNTPAEMESLLGNGFDYITTNEPEMLFNEVQKMRLKSQQ